MIRIYCDAAHAVLKETEVLTSGMTNYPQVLLTFSEDWDGMGKVAVCRAGPSTEQSVDVEGLVTYALGSTFVVPSECLAQSGVELYIGIQGVNAQAEVAIPTIWVSAGTIMEGVDIDEATNTGTATPTLVQQMIAYAGQMEEAADDLAQNVIRTVEVNDTYANRFGEVDVQLTDTGAGENRKLTFTFSNMKGNGIESIAFVQTGTNTGRVVVTESNGNVTNYDGIKDALDYVYNYIDQNVSTIITEYIELHPEYVTTVMDGSVSYQKLDTQLQGLADIVEQIDDIPTRTSDLINDSNFPEDADYVHTDNNYTDADEAKLAGIEAGANAYTHPTQTSRTGVPTADVSPGFGGTFQVNQIRNDTSGHVTAITPRTITMPSAEATTSAHGLMSAADKTKLNGIAAGAQVNTVTGVKGSAESSYRTGNINLSAENIGYDDGLSGHTSGSVGEELSELKGSLNSLPVGKVYHVGTGQEYTTLRAGIEAALQEENSTVIVHAGTYDMKTEFAAELQTNMDEYTGNALYNGIHIIGEEGAVVTAIFTGNESNIWRIYTMFSPFFAVSNHANNDYTIENLEIHANNCRYCVHDDPYGTGTYTHKYINCVMQFYNTMSPANYVQCIGGGLGKHSTIVIDGGSYQSITTVPTGNNPDTATSEEVISYHNSTVESAAQSVIYINNVVLKRYGYFSFAALGDSTLVTNVYIMGCKTMLPTRKLISGSNDNISIYEYNTNAFTPNNKITKQNLISNWLLNNGGSIDGTKLPINQRGQSAYTGNQIYSIDGWKLINDASLTVNATNVELTIPSGGQIFYWLEYPANSFAGIEMTLSVLLADGTMYYSSGKVVGGTTSHVMSLGSTGIDVFIYSPLNEPEAIGFMGTGTVQITAIKLEFGTGQTLALYDHDSNKFVLNDPFPDKAAMLNICERYYQLYSSDSARPSSNIDCRPTMYKTPTQGTVSIAGTTYYYNEAQLN